METILLPVKNIDSVGITNTDICILSKGGAIYKFSTPESKEKEAASAIIDQKSLDSLVANIIIYITNEKYLLCIVVDREKQTAFVKTTKD